MVTVEDVRHWAARPHDASQAFRFGAYLRSGGALVGAAGLRRRSVEPNGGWEWVDVSYWLAKSATRLGYATEATRRLALHAFDDLASPRVEVRTEPANSASADVARRLGFRHEGTLRSVGQRRGCTIDMAIHALLASERSRLDGVS